MDLQQGQEIVAFENSRTYNNLLNALTFEKITSTEIKIFSERAAQEGFLEYSEILEEISQNSRAAAIMWLRFLNNGILPDTLTNLTAAIERESFAGTTMYQEYSNIADQEGFTQISAIMSGVANIKMGHVLTLQRLRYNVESNEVFCKRVNTLWICMNCGHVMSGLCAPEICPVCFFPQSFYKVYTP